MHITLFKTPVVRTVFYWLALLLLKITGWKLYGKTPDIKKYVSIAAPHTSNWDFFYGLIMTIAFKQNLYWMGKKTIFRFPFGFIMKWFGGIPVDRGRPNNLVEEAIEQFEKNEQLIIAIPPEGTRYKVRYWKTGFYYIALGAKVPILMSFLDYEKKIAGHGPLIMPTGDIENDMKIINDFYKDIQGRYADNQSRSVTDVCKEKMI